MAVVIRRPSLLSVIRYGSAEATRRANASPARAAWVDEAGGWQHHDVDLVEGGFGVNAVARRRNRSNADISSAYGAVFTAIRKRSQAAAKARIVMQRVRQGAEPEEVPNHPAVAAIQRVNESLTFKQGMGLIEQHKLTSGQAFWVKRRNRLRVPVEFEIWNPDEVSVTPRADRPWVPANFKRHKANGTIETVAPEDMIWFRYMVDPRNPLNGLSPIGAVRVQVDTGMEALRFNQRFFDNDALPAAIMSAKDSGPGEVARIEDELERKFKGTDNKHRIMITEGDLTLTAMPISHRDMEFIEQMRWTKEEIGMVFEMSPILLGDNAQATKENLDGFMADFWQMIVNEVENTLEEFNEFYVRPDFGDDLQLAAIWEGIPALAGDKKLEAEIDGLHLASGVVTINEVRTREHMDPVEWGDTPVILTTMAPLDTRSGAEKDAAKAAIPPPLQSMQQAPADMPMSASLRSLQDAEDDARAGWERRLQRELKAILAHFDAEEAGRKRALEIEDVDRYSWDWWLRYGRQVIAELTFAYETALDASDFMATPLMPTHELAVRYAERRAAEMLVTSGRENVVEFTREQVRKAVAETIANGDSLRTLKNKLRSDYAFSDARAETVARTETAIANGKASLQAHTSNGYEGKRWLTAGDGLVCEICAGNAEAGAIPLRDSFPSGDDTVPGHPRCRCALSPVYELPRRTVKMLIKDASGNTLGVEEVVSRAS